MAQVNKKNNSNNLSQENTDRHYKDVWFDAQDVMLKYHVSRSTLRRWRETDLPCYKIGRKIYYEERELTQFIRRNQLEDFLKRRKK